MKSIFRTQILKISILFCLIAILITGTAVPALAADTQTAALHSVQGKVLSVNTQGSSFVIQNGNQNRSTITVDPNTKYFVLSMGKAESYVNSQVNKAIKQDKGKETRPGALKELHIPTNWRSNLGWLETFDTQAKFMDIQAGDRVIARVNGNNLAAQVLIVKAPVIQSVKGSITAFSTTTSPNTITITPPNNGQAVTLNINGNTRVSLKGFIAVQNGQLATAVYNRNTMMAQTISVLPAVTAVNPPAPVPSAANKLAFTIQPSGAIAGMPFNTQPVVTVQDINGNPITNSAVPVTLAIASGISGAALSGTITVNAVNGVATFSGLNINLAGSYTLSAASSGLTTVNSTAFSVVPGAAAKLVFTTQPIGAKAALPFATQPIVTVQDSLGNTVSGSAAAIALAIGTNPASGTLSGTTTVNAVNGAAAFSGLTISAAGNGYTLTAVSSGLTTANSNGFNIAAP
jgi:hypothetical protein